MIEVFSGSNPATAFVRMFIEPSNRWFLLYALSSFTAALAVFIYQASRTPGMTKGGLLNYIFPKETYRHRSAIADYWFFVANKLVFAIGLGALGGATYLVERSTFALLEPFGPAAAGNAPVWLAMSVNTLAWALAADFGLWLAHYFLHKSPILWEFHKVHHSAEVLTPITAGRVHPVDDALSILFSAFFGGIALALGRFAFGGEALMFTLFNLNFLLALFYIFGFHLRHSHVWLPYTGIWGKIFVSPAHHQVHHSVAQRHWDKNLGFMFAIWDWLFGTLYPVDKREEFSFGVNGAEEAEYHSVLALYLLPFRKVWRRLARPAPTRGLKVD